MSGAAPLLTCLALNGLKEAKLTPPSVRPKRRGSRQGMSPRTDVMSLVDVLKVNALVRCSYLIYVSEALVADSAAF